MKRSGKGLDVKTIEAAKPGPKPFRLSDGGGLLLDIRPSGAKVWICRITVDGKRRDMGLGGYPKVGLAEARRAAQEAQRAAKAGSDPITAREAAGHERKAARKAKAEASARTFKAVAELCITAQTPGWKEGRTAALWRSSLTAYAFPTLGDMPVADIGRAHVLRAIDEVWTSRPATAKKVLRRIGTVLRYAAAHGWRSNDNPADAKMLKHAGLPALPGGKHYPSLPWQRVPAFMKALNDMPGIAPLTLRFAILSGVRSVEARGARWSEIAFDGPVPIWTVPSARLKSTKQKPPPPLRVPLAPEAVDLLARAYNAVTASGATVDHLPRLAALRGAALVFPSSNPRRPLSDMALSAVVRRMNEAPEGQPPPWCDADGRAAVPHGFRASFRTWVQDTRPEDTEAAEVAQAHKQPNQVIGAYARSDLFDRRTPLMQAWAQYCEGTGAAGGKRAGKLAQ